MSKKCIKIGSEVGVRECFSRFSEELGYKVIKSQEKFPDLILETETGRKVRAEVEKCSKDFDRHGHPVDECDLIICWMDNWENCPVEVLELKGIPEIKEKYQWGEGREMIDVEYKDEVMLLVANSTETYLEGRQSFNWVKGMIRSSGLCKETIRESALCNRNEARYGETEKFERLEKWISEWERDP